MYKTLKTILLDNHFVGLEIFSEEGSDAIALLEAKKRRKELDVINFEKRDNLSKLNYKFLPTIPYFITLNTNQVLSKEVDSIESNDLKIVFNAFPNLKIDDFYYEIWRDDTKSIVSICRKNYIRELIAEFKEKNAFVYGISLGVTGLSIIKPFTEETSLQTNSHLVDFNNVILLNPLIKKRIIPYSINGLEVLDTFLLSFSGILSVALSSTKTSGNISILNHELSDAYYQAAFYRKVSRFVICFLLILLFVNFIFFNHYYKKSELISSTISANENTSVKITQLENEIKIKEEKIKTNFSPNRSKSSYIVNELTSNIPSSILLSELTYHPLVEKIKLDSEIKILSDEIFITGKTLNSSDFTKWIDTINSLKGVKKITISQFGKNETNETVFSLTLKLDSNEIKP